MKFKSTLILMAVFVVLLILVLFILPKKKADTEDEKTKLVDLSSEDVQKINLKKKDESLTFAKDDKGTWMITEPLQAKADTYEVDRLAQDFSGLKAERIVEEVPKDIAAYEIPRQEVTLWYKGKEQPIKILIGMENPLDKTLFAKKEDEKRVVLLSSSFTSLLDKKLFDFRQKDIFAFETGDAGSVNVKAKEMEWQASKKEEDWFLEKPVSSLAVKFKVEGVLTSLANLRAKEFIIEEKKSEDIKKYGLESPEYKISISLPAANRHLDFFLHKEGDNLYATTSDSPKIIAVEEAILTDLDKKPEELREKKVAPFESWLAHKVFLRMGTLEVRASKDAEDKWQLEGATKEEADASKVETFIRKIESLEAKEFIDTPSNLKDYGLDSPQTEVKIWTKEDDGKEKEVTVFIGTGDKEKKEVVVRNPRLNYLFRLDSSFFQDFPKERKDWLKAPEEAKKKDKK